MRYISSGEKEEAKKRRRRERGKEEEEKGGWTIMNRGDTSSMRAARGDFCRGARDQDNVTSHTPRFLKSTELFH